MFCEIETRDCPRARKFQEFPYLNDVAGRMLQYESENDSDAISELHRGYGNRDMIPVIHVVEFHPHLLGPEQQQQLCEINRV